MDNNILGIVAFVVITAFATLVFYVSMRNHSSDAFDRGYTLGKRHGLESRRRQRNSLHLVDSESDDAENE